MNLPQSAILFGILVIPSCKEGTPHQAVPEKASSPENGEDELVHEVRGEPVLTTRDAFRVVQVHTSGRLVLIGDIDGDAVDDLAVYQPGQHRAQIVGISSAKGAVVRTLWSGPVMWPLDTQWDGGGDLNQDGIPDLIIGRTEDSTNGRCSGAVLCISGHDGEILYQTKGATKNEAYGSSVSFAGDLDGDECDDFVVGGTQVDPEAGIHINGAAGSETVRSNGGVESFVRMLDGTAINLEDAIQAAITARSDLCGYVVAISGRSGSVLWRAVGTRSGHAFGRRVRAIGDVNGDGVADIVVSCEQASSEPAFILSGKSGEVLATLSRSHGPVGPAGDWNGDGTADVFLDGGIIDSTMRVGGVRIVSGSTFQVLAEIPYPEAFGEYGTTVALGDIDNDGFDDIAVGEPNFNLPGHYEDESSVAILAPKGMALDRALTLQSRPNSMSFESGVLLVVSGRTGKPVMGIWGRPGSSEGIGFAAVGLPDLDGNGTQELAVAGADAVYFFRGIR